MISWVAAAALAQAPQRYALIVGHNEGGVDRSTLRYAHDDARAIRDVLTTVGGVRSDHAVLLLDPSLDALEVAFEDLRTGLGDGADRSEVIFYYSGHSDEVGLLLGEQHLEYRDLRAHLDALPAKVRVAVLDSCASGALILSKGGRQVAPFLVDESVQVGGFAYITSSSADEVAQESERIGGSYFTYFLASGLRGAADTSRDGRVTLTEAYSFANHETLARTERTQHGPQHATYDIQLSGTGDLVLTDLGLTTSSLVLAEGLAGRALVRGVDGTLFAEFEKVAEQEIELALPEGSYTLTLLDSNDGIAFADARLEAGTSTLIAPEDLVAGSLEDTVARGTPIGPRPASIDGEAVPAQTYAVRVEFAPGLPPSELGEDQLALGLLAGRSGSLHGAAFGTWSYQVDGETRGLVSSMGFTSVGQLQSGVQTSFGANLADGGLGAQLTLGANFVHAGWDGLQVSAGLNHAAAGVRGAQLSTGVNLAPGGIEGVQWSLGANLSGGRSTGVQLSAGLNTARDLDGSQLAAMNVARDLRGLQFGLINIGRDVTGAQIGLINVARSVDGMPIGLFSFVKEGRHDLLVYASETDLVNVEARFGGNAIYTLIGAGASPTGQAHAAFGFGGHATFGDAWLDLDASLASYVPLGDSMVGPHGQVFGPLDQPPTGVARTRATFGFQVLTELAPFVGVSANLRVPVDDLRVVDVAPGWANRDVDLLVWPGVFGGIQF